MSILGLRGGNGNYLNFQASFDRWLVNKDEIKLNKLILDHHSVKTGCAKFPEGQPPEWNWDNKLGEPGPLPSAEYRRGFFVRIWLNDHGWLNWSTVGSGAILGFEDVFENIWGEREQHPDELPVLQYKGSKAVRIGRGNSRQPIFEVIGWVVKSSIPEDGSGSPPSALDAHPTSMAAATSNTVVLDQNLPF